MYSFSALFFHTKSISYSNVIGNGGKNLHSSVASFNFLIQLNANAALYCLLCVETRRNHKLCCAYDTVETENTLC